MENYKNVSQDIRNQLDAEAEVVQIILTGIDNDIYSTVDACPNAYDALSKEKEIDKLMALISLSFKKIYKPTNNNLRTSSSTSRANQDNTPRINRGTGYDNQRAVNVAGARENVEQVDSRDDTNDEPDNQELKAHYMYMAKIQEVTPDAADNSRPIFDTEPLQKVQNNNDNYNVFANDKEHPKQSESVNDTYLEEQGDTSITIDSLDVSTNGETVDQDDDDLAREHDLLASLIEKLKCEIDDSKNHLKKFQAKLNRYHDVTYASKVEIDCAKAKEMKKELIVHQETISIMSQEKKAQKKFHKTCEDKELEKVIALENKIKVLDDTVYKTSQSVQTMNMLNHNCKTSFVKPKFLKNAQRANRRLYNIGCYNNNLALMLAPKSDEAIRLAQESLSKLSDLIKPFVTTRVSRRV
ncbi:hypothetical protein Tco_1195090 [Tanacetum coccineum]